MWWTVEDVQDHSGIVCEELTKKSVGPAKEIQEDLRGHFERVTFLKFN